MMARPSQAFCALLALTLASPAEGRCAWQHEDCSHTGCCQIAGHRCFRKNARWAGCMKSCHPGVHHHDPPQHRTPWSCEPVGPHDRDCAAKGEFCGHLGCCKQAGHKCYEKDVHWASCRPSCQPDQLHHEDPLEHRTPWTCREIRSHENRDDGDEWSEDYGRDADDEADEIKREEGQGGHSEDLSKNWRGGLQATHFWDCNGGGCDASELRPWNLREYKYAPHYAPTDPAKHGGALYGEKLWLTGAASDSLTRLLGPDSDCCGSDGDGGGGCGQCLLVKTRESDHPDWLAVVMKKNRCPPWSNGCDKVHYDIAVPGFDNLQYSTANVCGDHSRSDTYIQRHHSAICGSVAPRHCNCHQLPSGTPEQRQIRDGCLLFKAWGWHHGTPKLDYRPVPCPRNFVDWVRVGKAFDRNGVLSLAGVRNASLALGGAPPALPPAPVPWSGRHAAGILGLGLLALAPLSRVALRWWRGRHGVEEPCSAEEGRLIMQ